VVSVPRSPARPSGLAAKAIRNGMITKPLKRKYAYNPDA